MIQELSADRRVSEWKAKVILFELAGIYIVVVRVQLIVARVRQIGSDEVVAGQKAVGVLVVGEVGHSRIDNCCRFQSLVCARDCLVTDQLGEATQTAHHPAGQGKK
jgi:hypothetical protein